MRNKLDSWRSTIIFVLIIIMMTALFFSRAVLSVSMMAFVAGSFFHKGIKKQFLRFFSSPLLWGMSFLFFIPLLSGLWSTDRQEWMDVVRTKLPLLFFPLAFAGYGIGYRFTSKQWGGLGYIFTGLVTGGVCLSLFNYSVDFAAINKSYLSAKTIVTPLENDHVRFSWLVSVAILLAGWLCVEKRKENTTLVYCLAAVVILLVVYLHVLAVRTGLFSFYIMVAGTAIWLIIKKIRWQWGLGLLLLVIALPAVAYKTIPTFRNRVKYFLYDRSFFNKGEYWPGSTDAVRIISLKAGWNVMQQHPVKGVGFGDVLPVTKTWYGEHYPEMIESDKIYPSGEWMIYGAAAGWPGFLLFSCCMLVPFFIQTNNKLPWWLLNATAALSFLFDIGLEVQFGVFIYSFVILWCYQWLNAKKM
ncbi:MAG TPA: O-antigen ligase family protein [Chitinophagaceae bacterium]|nr:O-antigen ligase family protein [Chitinophagaceae bacterium]